MRKTQIESMATPPLNMYISTPLNIDHENEKENDPNSLQLKINLNLTLNHLKDEELVNILLSKNAKYIRSVLDEKNALKILSHRINAKNKAFLESKCEDILFYIIDIMNNDQFMLHRNALRILQALCWFHPKCINQHLQTTLLCIVHLFRKAAPEESGELALDVIAQFAKIVDYKLSINCLLPIIQKEIEKEEEGNIGGGRKVFAALSIFDRIIVLSPTDWLKQKIEQFTKILISAYKFHREPMRSLIYLSIIFEGDTSFLNQHRKEQKIVQMMAKETDFTKWVKCHRPQTT